MNDPLFNLMGYGVRSYDLWVVSTAACCAVACGVLGCFLVLRRMSLLGDAISHAVLPGIAAGFMVSGSRGILPMMLGAGAAGVLTAGLSSALSRFGRVAEDAALGVVFTTLFALGVVLITFGASSVDLDPGCVLYGVIEMTPLDTVGVAGVQMPRAFVVLAVCLGLSLAVVLVFFKELTIVAFDPALATTMGFRAGLVHTALMAMVAAVTVASFEAVGSILVVAMLVAPGATAHLLTDRLSRMVLIAGIIGVLTAVVGYAGAVALNTSVAGMMSVAAGGMFAAVAVFAPRHGALARVAQRARLALRIVEEDVLGMLYRAAEGGAFRPVAARDVAEALRQPVLARVCVVWLRVRGMVRAAEGGGGSTGLALSAAGSLRGRQVVRSHRLWESYLAKHFYLPIDHLHEPAHRAEHFVRGTLERGIAEEVGGEQTRDPHGREIP